MESLESWTLVTLEPGIFELFKVWSQKRIICSFKKRPDINFALTVNFLKSLLFHSSKKDSFLKVGISYFSSSSYLKVQ